MENRGKNRIETSITVEKDAAYIWNTLVEFSNYRSWNPVVKHAAIYGPVSAGTGIKVLSGRWDFNFVIKNASAPKELVVEGRAVGLKIRLCFYIKDENNVSMVTAVAYIKGWISRIFRKRIIGNIEESLDIFLMALRKRVLKGDSYEIHRDKAQEDDSKKGIISMPTPFNIIYKTRSKKFRKGRSGLK